MLDFDDTGIAPYVIPARETFRCRREPPPRVRPIGLCLTAEHAAELARLRRELGLMIGPMDHVRILAGPVPPDDEPAPLAQASLARRDANDRRVRDAVRRLMAAGVEPTSSAVGASLGLGRERASRLMRRVGLAYEKRS